VHDPGRAESPAARLFAWMGAGLFVLSLSYFLYRYWTAFGMRADPPLRPGPLVWNVVLFSAFALHHSVFARDSVRRTLAHALGPLERSFYVWVASLMFIAVCKLWLPVPGTVWELNAPLSVALLFVQLTGIVISVYSASLIDIWELAGIRQLNSQPPTPDSQTVPEFKTTGPYRWVRHPIYLGWFLIVFGAGTMTMTRFVFAVVSCAYILLAIPFEERSLRQSTKGAYDRYMQKVPRKLVPGLY
jgi:protein-S-isoprenylcysteine O-methyltransferase Ste14